MIVWFILEHISKASKNHAIIRKNSSLFMLLKVKGGFLPIIKQSTMGKTILRKGKRPTKCLTQLYDKITRIQADILGRLQKLKLLPKFKLCQHLNIQNHSPSAFDSAINYYDHYWRRFFLNEIAKAQIVQLTQSLNYLSKRLNKIQQLLRVRRQLLEPYESKTAKERRENRITNYQCLICRKQFQEIQALFLHRDLQHAQELSPLEMVKQEQSIFEEFDEQKQGQQQS